MDSAMIERWVRAALYGTIFRNSRSRIRDCVGPRATALSCRTECRTQPDEPWIRPDSAAASEQDTVPNAKGGRLPEPYELEEDYTELLSRRDKG